MQTTKSPDLCQVRTRLDAFFAEYADATLAHPYIGHYRVLAGADPATDGVVFEIMRWQGAVHLGMIQALTPGRGEGRRGMSFLTVLADKHGVSISGSIKRLGERGLSKSSLRAWYKRNGFIVSQGGLLLRPAGGVKVQPKRKAGFSARV